MNEIVPQWLRRPDPKGRPTFAHRWVAAGWRIGSAATTGGEWLWPLCTKPNTAYTTELVQAERGGADAGHPLCGLCVGITQTLAIPEGTFKETSNG